MHKEHDYAKESFFVDFFNFDLLEMLDITYSDSTKDIELPDNH